MRLSLLILLLTMLIFGPSTPGAIAAETHEADVIIYGGTSAGVIAAVQVKKMGRSVIVVAPEKHLGGLSAGGLGWTDSGNKAVIGGLALEYYQRIKKVYDKDETWKWQKASAYSRYQKDNAAIWTFEPHIAEQIFEDYIREFKIPVHRQQRLDLKSGVKKEGTNIIEIKTESGNFYRGKRFIDATYEGDLLAKAGVTYTVGREANSKYGETLNGVQIKNAVSHQFTNKVSAYVIPGDPKSGLLPRVHDGSPGVQGEGDHRLQAYNYRVCLTQVSENRVPFPKPEGYDAKQYELLLRDLKSGSRHVFGKFDMLPNLKTDTNNHGSFSTDNIGMNYDYPDGDYETRAKILKEHETYQKGYFYFLCNDPRVPEDVRKKMSKWGLAKDEFLDNGHWPHQIYVREARRMVSDFVMAEPHLRLTKPTPEPIGMGSYNMDSHNVQRYVDKDGFVRNEGDVQRSPGGPYPVSYRAIVPKKSDCTNLLVPVCLSSSHIAYGSIRMEPVFMILGQSAATAICQSLEKDQTVQDVDYIILQKRLLEDAQVLEYERRASKPRVVIDPGKLAGIVIDDTNAKKVGEWTHSSSTAGFVGSGYLHDSNAGQGSKSVVYTSTIKTPGKYEIRLSYPPNPNRASNVAVTIDGAQKPQTVTVNQKKEPNVEKVWVSLGTFEFDANATAKVTVTNKEANGYVIADCVQLLPVKVRK